MSPSGGGTEKLFEEMIAENIPVYPTTINPIDPRSSLNSKHKKKEENHTKIPQNQIAQISNKEKILIAAREEKIYFV